MLYIEGVASKLESTQPQPIMIMTKEMATPMNVKQPYAPLQRRAFTVQQQFQFEVAKEHQRFADQDRHLQQLLSEGSSSDGDKTM